MSFWCWRLRRKAVPYFDGEVSPRAAARLENHIAGCRECREFFARLRAGHQAAQEFGRLGPEHGAAPPDFGKLWATIGAPLEAGGRRVEDHGGRLGAAPRVLAVSGLVTLMVASAALVVVLSRRALWPAGGRDGARTAREFRDFTPLRITDFAKNTKSRVVTEGYVRGVYFDEEEKTLHIKLVEIQQKSEPFVICEVRSPGQMNIPAEGSRVRVYGRAHYDAQPGRGWSEVNPVLNIDVLKR